jgi:putative transposase
MIAATVEELAPLIGTRPACRALGASPATIYRRRRPAEPRPARPRPIPARALTGPERQQVLDVLHSERFVDVSPEETWATLLDEGSYLCSPRTMYRLLAAKHGGVRERRNQLTHPPYAKPELLAERPNQLWSWDISKLKGPAKWTWFYLYVILDVFSRYIVGWTVAYRETAQLATALIEQATKQQQITPKILTLHADRGGPMRAKPVAFLLADLGVTKTHARPYTSSDNPYSESNFKTLKYRPAFSSPVRLHRARPRALPRVRRLVQPRASPLRDRADDPSRHAPRPRQTGPRRPCRRPRHRLRAQTRTVRASAARPTRATDCRVDQQAGRHKGGRSLNWNAKCLTGLDRLRCFETAPSKLPTSADHPGSDERDLPNREHGIDGPAAHFGNSGARFE